MSASSTTMLATVLRGLRARALLSVGSVLLTALAIGSAVLGPIFSAAVTNSYLVTRLDDAPNALTGLTWRFTPGPELGGRPAAAVAAALAAADRAAAGPFAEPQPVLQSRRLPAFGDSAQVQLLAGDRACDHLEVLGACPSRPGEVLMLVGDQEDTGLPLGSRIQLGADVAEVTLVGTYRVPPEEEDHWFNPDRFRSLPGGEERQYQPAPLITVPATFRELSPAVWSVLVDRRLQVPADLELADLDAAIRAAAALDAPAADVAGGRLRGESLNDLPVLAEEVRTQQATARDSIAPAVFSLVLVALALLLRLLMAAADLRLPELALASLRGLSRRQLWMLGLSEPLALLLLAVPVGGALGVGLALGLVRWWLVPALPLPLPWTAALAGAGVAVATLLVAILAVGLVLRVSLSDQLTGVRRPRRSSRTTLVLQLALVSAALAVLTSKLSAGTTGDPDVTDLVLPVLLAVVAGVAATRATAGLAAWWTRRRPRGRSLGGFVAARAISRRQEGTLVILPVTAAIAICVFGVGVFDSAAQWRASVAATAAPAPVVWTSSLPLQRTVDLTRSLDPEGRWLMAASTVNTPGPTFTVADLSRLERVVSWQDQWTPGVSAGEVADALSLPAQQPTVTGRRVGLTVDTSGLESGEELHVRLRLGVPDGRVHHAFLGPFGRGTSTAEAATPYCRGGCRLEALTIGGPAALPRVLGGSLRLSDLVAGGRPVPGAVDGAGWARTPGASAEAAVTRVAAEGGDLVVDVDSEGAPIIAQLTAGGLPAALPVVRGVDAPSVAAAGSATSAFSFDVDPVYTARSIPLLGPVGLLVDHDMVSTGRDVYDQDVPVYVLARADTPAPVLRGLQDRGASVSTTLAEVQRSLDQSAYALALRLYAVVAVAVLLMALAGLFVSTAVQLPARRRDAASLRVVGVSRSSVMSAVVRELGLVLGGTALAGLAAGTLAQYVVLRTVTLGYVEDLTTPALVAAVDWSRLVVLGLLSALLFGLVALASAALTVRGARGATLREDAR